MSDNEVKSPEIDSLKILLDSEPKPEEEKPKESPKSLRSDQISANEEEEKSQPPLETDPSSKPSSARSTQSAKQSESEPPKMEQLEQLLVDSQEDQNRELPSDEEKDDLNQDLPTDIDNDEQISDLPPEEKLSSTQTGLGSESAPASRASSKRQSAQTSTRKTNKSTAKSTKRKQPPEPQPVSLPPEEVEAALDMLLHGVPPEDIMDPDMLRACIESLKEMKNSAVKSGDYLEADRLAQLIKQCQQAADAASFTGKCSQKLNYYMDKKADAQELVDSMNDQWEGTFQEFEQGIDQKLRELTTQHEEELSQFDNNIPEDLPAKYQKYSVELLQLRKKEHLLLRNEEYQEAHKVKQKADDLEAEEMTQQHHKLQDDIGRSRNALIERHNQQFDTFAQFVNERRRLMLRERDKALQGPVRRLEHYTRIVENIEQKGIPPNPNDGFTTNRVNRKQAIKTLRSTAQTPVERSTTGQARRQDTGPIPAFRPPSVKTGFRQSTSSMSNRQSTSQMSNRQPSQMSNRDNPSQKSNRDTPSQLSNRESSAQDSANALPISESQPLSNRDSTDQLSDREPADVSA